MNTKELIDEAASFVDSLLQSLNWSKTEIDEKWVVIAQRRLSEMRSRSVKPVSGTDVFERIWKRFDI